MPPIDIPPSDHVLRHRARLLEGFLDELLRLQPHSVLDVGCGNGFLVRELAAQAIPATGLEADSRKAEALEAEGLAAVHGEAEDLPFSEDEFDWVVLRHVLHHLPGTREALAQAARVARRGIVVAEPCFPESLPPGRVAKEFDAWLKNEERKRGRCHHLNLDLPAIVDELEVAGMRPDEARVHQPMDHRPPEWLPEEVLGVDPDLLGSEAFLTIDASARRFGVSVNGSLIVIARANE